ncbi:hypothetical protein ACFLRF_05710, partial [Candidatus Altiarchaeota archaeon]
TGLWDVSSTETCQDSTFYASDTGGLKISGGSILTLDTANVVINDTILAFENDGILRLTDSSICFT